MVGGELNTQTNIAGNHLIGYFNWCFGQKVEGRAGLPQTTAISPVAWWAVWAARVASRRSAAGALERQGSHRRAHRLMFRLLPERSEALATETVGNGRLARTAILVNDVVVEMMAFSWSKSLDNDRIPRT